MARKVERERRLVCTMLALGLLVFVEIMVDCIIGGGMAYAAAQGALGATSMGSIMLSVRKNAIVGISGLRDMTANWTSGDRDLVWSNDVCIFSNTPSNSYTITATGARTAQGAFVLSDGTNQLPYQVSWNDGGNGNLTNQGVSLQPGVASPTMHKASGSSECTGNNGRSNARLMINIPASKMEDAKEGNYSESLTLLVSPT